MDPGGSQILSRTAPYPAMREDAPLQDFGYQVLGMMATLMAFRLFSAWTSIILMLPGTLCHEATHWLVGMVTGARPMSFSIIPHRVNGKRWRLGVVRFMHPTSRNRPLVGLSPLLLLPCAWHLVEWQVRLPATQEPSLWWAYLVAVAVLSAWPSAEDRKLALEDSSGLMFLAWGFFLGLTVVIS